MLINKIIVILLGVCFSVLSFASDPMIDVEANKTGSSFGGAVYAGVEGGNVNEPGTMFIGVEILNEMGSSKEGVVYFYKIEGEFGFTKGDDDQNLVSADVKLLLFGGKVNRDNGDFLSLGFVPIGIYRDVNFGIERKIRISALQLALGATADAKSEYWYKRIFSEILVDALSYQIEEYSPFGGEEIEKRGMPFLGLGRLSIQIGYIDEVAENVEVKITFGEDVSYGDAQFVSFWNELAVRFGDEIKSSVFLRSKYECSALYDSRIGVRSDDDSYENICAGVLGAGVRLDF